MSEIDSHLTETDRPNAQISRKSSQVNGAVLQFKKDEYNIYKKNSISKGHQS
jgi:hypothetical protein